MRNLISLIILLFSVNALAEQYLCIGEQTAGFKYSEIQKNWVSTNFNSDHKYTLSNSSGKYELKTSGFDEPLATCSAFNEFGVIFCDGWVNFVYYQKSGRFTESSMGSYHLVGSDFFPVDSEKVPNPTITIGTCTAL